MGLGPELPPLTSKQGTECKGRCSKDKLNDCDNSTDCSSVNSPRGVLDSSISSSDYDTLYLSDVVRLRRPSSQWSCLIAGFLLRKKKTMRRIPTFYSEKPDSTVGSDEEHRIGSGEFDEEILRGRHSWRSFAYEELAVATDNFSPDKLLGKGGHAEVYKGCLPDGQLVAVKKLTKKQSEDERVRGFLAELGIIGHVNHPNAAQLLGFSVEGGLYLVLEYSPHGSLASVLHGSKKGLEWKVRFKIALGIAEGLLYLHQKCHRRIIHRDIKATNILLTDDYQPQISDFGLAKWLPDKLKYHIVFPVEGTIGYLAPEYFMHGIVNEKIDVFAYGVLLLELITGRRAVDSSQQSLVIWAKPLLDADNMNELTDPSLGDAYDPDELKRAVSTASLCIHHLSTFRPTMNRVLRLLRGEEEEEKDSVELMDRAPRLDSGRPSLFGSGDFEDYTSSKYIDELDRHKQLALEQ